MDSWRDYVVRISGTEEQKVIAEKSGIGATVINRWFKERNEPSAKLVVAFARAYSRPPVEALVAAGVIAEGDAASAIEVQRDLRELSDDDLLREVRRRMSHRSQQQDQGIVRIDRVKSNPLPPDLSEADAASRRRKQSDDPNAEDS